MSKKIYFIAGLIFLLASIADLVVWIVVSAPEEKSFDAAVNDYIGLYPKYLADPIKLTLLNIILSLMAIGCFLISIRYSYNLYFKRVCYGLIIFSGFLAFWNLFSLM